SPWVSRSLLVVLALSRPAGIFLCGLFALASLSFEGRLRDKLKHAWQLVLPSLAAFAAQLVFRLAYYADWIPNPARIKLALTPERLRLGWVYVSEAIALLSPQFLAIVWGSVRLLARQGRSRSMFIVATLVVGWSSYVCF